jgi:hypothetical protein
MAEVHFERKSISGQSQANYLTYQRDSIANYVPNHPVSSVQKVRKISSSLRKAVIYGIGLNFAAS